MRLMNIPTYSPYANEIAKEIGKQGVPDRVEYVNPAIISHIGQHFHVRYPDGGCAEDCRLQSYIHVSHQPPAESEIYLYSTATADDLAIEWQESMKLDVLSMTIAIENRNSFLSAIPEMPDQD